MDNLEIPLECVKQKQQIYKYYDDDKTRNMWYVFIIVAVIISDPSICPSISPPSGWLSVWLNKCIVQTMDDHDDVLMNYKLLSHNILHKTRHSPGNIIPCASAVPGLQRVNKQLYSKTATDMVLVCTYILFAIFDPHFFILVLK